VRGVSLPHFLVLQDGLLDDVEDLLIAMCGLMPMRGESESEKEL
jgi:hypothetical protein